MEKKNNKVPKWLEITEYVVTIMLALVMTLYFIGKACGSQPNSTANASNNLTLFNPFYGSITLEQETTLDGPLRGDLPSFLPSPGIYNQDAINNSDFTFRWSTYLGSGVASINIRYNDLWFESIPEDVEIFNLTFTDRWLSSDMLFTDSPISFDTGPYGEKRIIVELSFFDISGQMVDISRSIDIGFNNESEVDLSYLLESSLLSNYSPTYNGYYFISNFNLRVVNIASYSGGSLGITIPYVFYDISNQDFLEIQSDNDAYFSRLVSGSSFNWLESFVQNINSFLSIELLPNFSFRDILWLALAIPLVMWFLKAWLGG